MTQNTSAPRRIVVGVDTSDNAARAAVWAVREAADRGLALHLVYALDLPGTAGMVLEPPEYGRKQHQAGAALLAAITGKVRELRPNVVVTSEVSELSPARTLVALSQDAELVVTGTRGHGGFAGMLLGSVSMKLAAHSHCPVIVVRGEQPNDPLDEIVLGVESGEHEAPIRFAFEAAVAHGAALRVVRAWNPANLDRDLYLAGVLADRNRAFADDVADLLKGVREDYPGIQVAISIVRGNAVPALINEASGARMLVVGARRAQGPLSVGAGYVVQGLLAHSGTPVAVVLIN